MWWIIGIVYLTAGAPVLGSNPAFTTMIHPRVLWKVFGQYCKNIQGREGRPPAEAEK